MLVAVFARRSQDRRRRWLFALPRQYSPPRHPQFMKCLPEHLVGVFSVTMKFGGIWSSVSLALSSRSKAGWRGGILLPHPHHADGTRDHSN